MPIIELPDGTELEMPDNPNPQEIARFKQIREHFAAKSAPAPESTPRPEGAYPAPTMMERVTDTIDRLPEPVKETGRVLASGVEEGVKGIPRLAGMLPELAAKAVGADKNPRAQHLYDNPSRIEKAATDAWNWIQGNQAPQPTTPTGKVAKSLVAGATGGIAGPGGLARPLLSAGVGTTAAGVTEAVQAATDNPLLATGAGVVGGFAAGGLGAVRGTSKGTMQQIAGDIPEERLREGAEKMKRAKEAGVDMTLGQALPEEHALRAMENRLANTTAGKKVQDVFMAQPGQAEELVQRRLAASPGQVLSPRDAENAMQEAATAKLTAVRGEANEAYRSILNRNGAPSQLWPDTVHKLDSELAALAEANPGSTLAKLTKDVRAVLFQQASGTERVRQRTADGSRWEYVEKPTTRKEAITDPMKLKQAIEDTLDAYSTRMLNTNTKTARQLGYEAQIMDKFRAALASDSPEIGEAAKAYSTIMNEVYNPLKKSVVGRVAGVKGAVDTVEAPGGRVAAIFDAPRDPNLKGKSEIQQLGDAVRETPGVFANMWKTHISSKVAEAVDSARGGQVPETFMESVTKVFGDPRVRSAKSAATEDKLRIVARDAKVDPDELIKGWKHTVEILSDLTRRPTSITSVSEREMADAAQGAFARAMARFGILSPVRESGRKLGDALSTRALETASELLTDPKGIDTLIQMSRKPAYSHAAVTTLATFLGTNAGLQSALKPPEKKE